MSNTIRDAKSASLGAFMDVNQVIQEFAAEWLEPELRRAQAVIEKNLLAQWDAHAPELEAAKAEQPEMWATANKQIEDIRKKYKMYGGNYG